VATRTEDLTAQITGVATVFVTQRAFLPGTLEVYLNGVRQRRGTFFFENGVTAFGTTEAPAAGDTLTIQYETAESGSTEAFPLVIPSGTAPWEG
jgi:hypothetical protein